MKNYYANNGDLRSDWAKYQSAKKITIDKGYDSILNPNFPFILEINDNDYFYATQKERDEDWEIAKKVLKHNEVKAANGKDLEMENIRKKIISRISQDLKIPPGIPVSEDLIRAGLSGYSVGLEYAASIFKAENGTKIGNVREMDLHDAVLYNGKTYYITQKDGITGLTDLSSGAWGSDYPFTPLSRIDVDQEVTDMYGNKVFIPYEYKAEDGYAIPDSELNMLNDLGFTVDQMEDYLREKFKDSFRFRVYMPKGRAADLVPDYDTPIISSLRFTPGATKIFKDKLYFPTERKGAKSHSRSLIYKISQGDENTYFDFILIDNKFNEYIGTFGFKDGDVGKEYVTRFVSFLHEAYGFPFTVKHMVAEKGARISTNWAGKKHKENWGKEDLYSTYSNNLDLVADVSDYYKKLENELGESYAKEMKEDLLQVLQTGKMIESDGSSVKFKRGGELKMCPVGTGIQTLIFDKDVFSQREDARKWVDKHDFNSSYVDVNENSYRFRQESPSFFDKDSFRTITITDGVKAVIGCPVKKYNDGGGIDDVQITMTKKGDEIKFKGKYKDLEFEGEGEFDLSDEDGTFKKIESEFKAKGTKIDKESMSVIRAKLLSEFKKLGIDFAANGKNIKGEYYDESKRYKHKKLGYTAKYIGMRNRKPTYEVIDIGNSDFKAGTAFTPNDPEKYFDIVEAKSGSICDFRAQIQELLQKKYSVSLKDTGFDDSHVKLAMEKNQSVDDVVAHIAKTYDLTPKASAGIVVNNNSNGRPKSYICIIKDRNGEEINSYPVSHNDDAYIDSFLIAIGVKLKASDTREVIEDVDVMEIE